MLDLNTYDRAFLLTDEQVATCCLPVLSSLLNCQARLADLPTLILPAGEEHKNITSVQRIWDFLFAQQATRSSLLINLGGGVITDMGGFAASTYMRGMSYMNIPTTLLAMVDAATGGKTGIDYSPSSVSDSGLIKNAIGVFAEPVETIIDARFLATLPADQLLSGYAEMLKHAILQGREAFAELLDYDLREVSSVAFGELIRQSVAFKQSVVEQDPRDKGLRQILNLGHTVGHAIEALCLTKHSQMVNGKCLHGYCVMYGMVAEAYLSHTLCGLTTEVVSTLSRFMLENYGAAPVTCNDYEQLLQLMQHDKKNREQGAITCTLLRDIGQPVIGQSIPPDQFREALEYLCSL
ncbi:MAG: 3-dehydroquinate synthase [Paludibacteraceae bacterium]|nr:3-dehydroquinate synthase [Paludibacteraceae bacterium]